VEQKSLRADFKRHPIDLSAIPLAVHEEAMRLAIAATRSNPALPFGAVIVRAVDRQVMATGVNTRAAIRHSMAKSAPSTITSRDTAISAGARLSSIRPASLARYA
jgi:hypothetical protein